MANGKGNKHSDKSAKAKKKHTKRNENRGTVVTLLRDSITRAASNGWLQGLGTTALVLGCGVVVAMVLSKEVKTAAILFGLVATAAIWLAVFLVVHSASAADVGRDALRVRLGSAFIGDRTQALFFVRYPSQVGDTLSPLPIALDVTLTNTRNVALALDHISVEVRQSKSGWLWFRSWEKVSNVPIMGLRVYWIYTGFKESRLLDFKGNGFDQIMDAKPIPPNSPIIGWLFFEAPEDFDSAEGTTSQWRLEQLIPREMSMKRPRNPKNPCPTCKGVLMCPPTRRR